MYIIIMESRRESQWDYEKVRDYNESLKLKSVAGNAWTETAATESGGTIPNTKLMARIYTHDFLGLKEVGCLWLKQNQNGGDGGVHDLFESTKSTPKPSVS